MSKVRDIQLNQYGMKAGRDWSYIETRRNRIEGALGKGIKLILQIGKDLSEVHERLANNGNGKFTQWVEKCCGISGRTARRYISAFETFGEDAGTVSGTFDARTMYLLSSDNTPEAAIEQALALAKKGKVVNYDSAKEIIEKNTSEEEDELSGDELTGDELDEDELDEDEDDGDRNSGDDVDGDEPSVEEELEEDEAEVDESEIPTTWSKSSYQSELRRVLETWQARCPNTEEFASVTREEVSRFV